MGDVPRPALKAAAGEHPPRGPRPADGHPLVRRLTSVAAALLPLVLFSVALWVLHRELAAIHPAQVVAAIEELPATRLLAALALTVAGYAVLTLYDRLGLRYADVRLPYRRSAVVSVVAYGFSNAIGHALFTATPLRFRLYSAEGVSGERIGRVVAFCFAAFWIGFFALAGGVFTVAPAELPDSVHLPLGGERPLGLVLLAVVALYLVATVVGRPLRLGRWRLPLPTPRLAAAQLAVSCADWTLLTAVLFVLLPPGHGLSPWTVAGAFLLANMAGVLSQVPGGLGVLETVMVLTLTPRIPAAGLLGALVLFRAVYYLLPLSVAAVTVLVLEVHRRRAALRRAFGNAADLAASAAPRVLAVVTFFLGAALLLTGVPPAPWGRLHGLAAVLSLPVLEVSHLLASLAGAGLLVVAHGLLRRLDAAWMATVALTAAGMVTALLRGLDWSAALPLAALLALLLPLRGAFPRRAALTAVPFGAGWWVAVAGVFAALAWLLLVLHRHSGLAADTLWTFAVDAHAPRAVRGVLVAAVAVLLAGLTRLLRPAPPPPDLPGDADLARAQRIAAAYPGSYAALALSGDKRLLFAAPEAADGSTGGAANEPGGFLMFAVEGRSWVALGDPVTVGPSAAETAGDLAWRLRDLAEKHGGRPVFYAVTATALERYVDLGLSLYKLGEEARVPLDDFSLDGPRRKALRHELHRAERDGATFEVLEPRQVAPRVDELRAVSDAWLAAKGGAEKSFSLGFFSPAYLCRLPLAAVRREGRLVAFANLLPGDGVHELSIDLMRHTPDAPAGVMTFLFVRLMEWGREAGYRSFNLGMAPLAGVEAPAGSPAWNRLAAQVYLHGEHFYHFQGLRRFKEKFTPLWEPRYLACPGGLALPQVIADVTALVSGGLGRALRP